jgi:hypothetical protein
MIYDIFQPPPPVVDSEPAVQGETESEKLVVAVELNGEDKVDDEMPVVEAPPASNGLSKLNGVFNTTEVEEVAEGVRANRVYNEWVLPTVTGRSPSARYQHAAEVVNNKLYVIGGNHNGRYLNDVQVHKSFFHNTTHLLMFDFQRLRNLLQDFTTMMIPYGFPKLKS